MLIVSQLSSRFAIWKYYQFLASVKFQNFLYLSSFLLRISSMGPSSLLKALLSIDTIVAQVRTLTLACLGIFLTRAISPKQSPYFRLSQKYRLLLASLRSATRRPQTTIQNLSPESPCLITYSPGEYLASFRTSQICVLSQGSIESRSSTFLRVSSQSFFLFTVDSLTILLKVFLSKAQSFPLVLALIVAALGALQRRASSPKASPILQVLRYVVTPSIFLWHSNSPSSTIKRTSPPSPSSMMVSPGLQSLSCMASMTILVSLSSSPLNRMDLLRRMRMRVMASSDLGQTGGLNSSFRLNSPQTSAETADRFLLVFLDLRALKASSSTMSSYSSEMSMWVSRGRYFLPVGDPDLRRSSSHLTQKSGMFSGLALMMSTVMGSSSGLTLLLRNSSISILCFSIDYKRQGVLLGCKLPITNPMESSRTQFPPTNIMIQKQLSAKREQFRTTMRKQINQKLFAERRQQILATAEYRQTEVGGKLGELLQWVAQIMGKGMGMEGKATQEVIRQVEMAVRGVGIKGEEVQGLVGIVGKQQGNLQVCLAILCSLQNLEQTLPAINNLLLDPALSNSAASFTVDFGFLNKLLNYLQEGQHVQQFREITCYFTLILQQIPPNFLTVPLTPLLQFLKTVLINQQSDPQLISYSTCTLRLLQTPLDCELIGSLISNIRLFDKHLTVKQESFQMLREGIKENGAMEFYEQGGLTLCIQTMRDKDFRVAEISVEMICRCISGIGSVVESGLNRSDFAWFIFHSMEMHGQHTSIHLFLLLEALVKFKQFDKKLPLELIEHLRKLASGSMDESQANLSKTILSHIEKPTDFQIQ